RVGQHLFDVVLHEGEGGGDDDGDGPDHGHVADAVPGRVVADPEGGPEHPVAAGHQVHAGHDHGGRVDEGGHGGGAGHGVGQPGVQGELGALADDTHEQGHGPDHQHGVVDSPRQGGPVQAGDVEALPVGEEQDDDPDEHPRVTQAG